jgi:AraC-like DNA-binding protein
MHMSETLAGAARVVFLYHGVYFARPGFANREHYHADMWQAEWVLSGHLVYALSGDEVTVGPDEIMFIPPGLVHRLTSACGFSCRILKFQLPLRAFGSPLHLRLTERTPLEALLAREVFAPREAVPWTMTSGYLGALLRLMEPAPASREPAVAAEARDPIAEAHQFAVAHLKEPLTVGRLAGVACLSVPQFSRRFRAATGLSPARWIARQRLMRAAELLRYADLSVQEIAGEVGYVDLPTFSKAFRRWLGVSPSQHRAGGDE